MCTRPIIQDGNTFACRTCDECIATRRHGWIARAMAEKAMHKHTLCLALTYSEDTQETRDAARMFCYADVRAFLARLRSALRREYGEYTLRFICAGEQGSRDDRCHWHLIIYSDRDIRTLGTVTGLYGPITDPDQMLTIGKHKRRLNWSMWGNGFVTFQEPDQGGMAYVLSYCLKDQFIGEKSRNTMREAKSENFATGLFRMSKRPSIGHSWLMQKLAALDETHSVLPSPLLHVPDMSGYWHPNGLFREKLLWTLVALNQRAVWATGANAPQWAALLASCRDNPKDMEILNGKEEEDERPIEQEFDFRSREYLDREHRRETVNRCANLLPCTDCLHHISDGRLAALGVARIRDADERPIEYYALRGFDPVHERQKTRGSGLNPYCQKYEAGDYALTFPASGHQ